MLARNLAVLTMALLMSIAAFSGEQQHMKIEIAVEGDDGDAEISFDSKDAGFSLHDLEVGETRSFDTEGGEASVTRTDDGFEFDVDGQKIDLDDLDEMHPGGDEENVFVIKDASEVRVFKTDSPDAVTILTGAPLDETTKAKLKKVLADSGATGEVLFMDGGELLSEDGAKHGQHHKVHIVKKEIEVTD